MIGIEEAEVSSSTFTFTFSNDGLTLTIKGVRTSKPLIYQTPDMAANSKVIKVIFWYLTESHSFKALVHSSLRNTLIPMEFFFNFLNSRDINGISIAGKVIGLDGELSGEFVKIFDNYLIAMEKSLTYRMRFKRSLKKAVKEYFIEYPEYRSSPLYTPLLENILSIKTSSPSEKPKNSAGSVISMIACGDQQKSFEGEWFKAFMIHFPTMLSKLRKEIKQIPHVKELLSELETKLGDNEYLAFAKGKSLTKQPVEYVQKTFKFYEAILSDGSEFVVDCLYHSLHPKLFDDHELWLNKTSKAPLIRIKPDTMNDVEWLEYRRNSLNCFKRKMKGNNNDYIVFLYSNPLNIHFSIPFPFTLENLVKPTATEYLLLRYLFGWHQMTEESEQNNLSLDDIEPFDDGVIRVLDAYKKRTGDTDGIRNIPMKEFTKTDDEFKVFEIYGEMLSESYKNYPSFFNSEKSLKRSLFALDSKRTRALTHDSFIQLFKNVSGFKSGRTGQNASAFYDLYYKLMQMNLAKGTFPRLKEAAQKKILEEIKSFLTDEWQNLTPAMFEKDFKSSKLTPNSFRLAAQGQVHSYAVYAGKKGVKQHLKHNSADEVLGAFHAHTGEMDHEYMIRSRNPFLAVSENEFGKQVASEMLEQATVAWNKVLAPAEHELRNQISQTDVWSLEDLREHLGISSLEEMCSYRNESEEARNYLIELLEKEDMIAFEGYGHQVLGAINQSNHRQIIIDSPLTCFLMKHQINYLDSQLEAFLNKKISPHKEQLDSITVKALVTKAYFSEIIETRFSETTRKGAEQLLKDYSHFPPIQL